MSAVGWYAKLRTGSNLKPGWAGVCQITNGLMAADVPETTIRDALMEVSNEGGRYLHFDSNGEQRPRSTTERMVRDAIRKTRSRHTTRPTMKDRAETIGYLAELRSFVDADPRRWHGRGGGTDRAVLLAAFEIAMTIGKVEFNASVRQLADAANIGVKGALNATKRLSDWLEIVELGHGTLGSTLRFRGYHGNPLCPLETVPEGCRHDLMTSDVWRWEGLGKSAARVYEALDGTPTPSAQIAAAMGISGRTARYHLAKLRSNGLAVAGGDGWVCLHRPLADLAEELGVAGRGESQRLLHRSRVIQRGLYLQHVSRSPRQRKDEATLWWETWWGSLQPEQVIARAS